MMLWDLDIEKNPGWTLKSHLKDCFYEGGDMSSLSRYIVEIKTYEDVYTGNMVVV